MFKSDDFSFVSKAKIAQVNNFARFKTKYAFINNLHTMVGDYINTIKTTFDFNFD